MDVNVKEQKDNVLLSRKEAIVEVSYDKATPSNVEMQKQIAAKTKADEKLIVIKKIDPSFGHRKAVVSAYIYSSKEELEKIEGKVEEAPKEEKAEAPKEEKKEESEAPKEEKAEEKSE